MSRFLNERYNFPPYVPGEQPQDKRYIKLNTNESPYPPSKGVIAAVSCGEVEKLRLYSDPECKSLKKSFAKLYGVGENNVYFSNGSDDILNFAFMAFSKSGAVFPEISYGFYNVFAELHTVDFETKPLNDDFTINPADYFSTGKMVVIANPNAPTGLLLSLETIEKIVKSNPQNVVIIDEAYIDFGGVSCYKLTEKYDNLLVVGTFSKSRSMAGARLGFAIANEHIIADLERIKYSTNPYNINRLTQIAGEAAILDNDYYMDNCKKIITARNYTETELKGLGFNVIPSYANFVFAESPDISGEKLYLKLKDNGILIRHFSTPKISNFNRITIGTMDEMKEFISTVKLILEGNL